MPSKAVLSSATTGTAATPASASAATALAPVRAAASMRNAGVARVPSSSSSSCTVGGSVTRRVAVSVLAFAGENGTGVRVAEPVLKTSSASSGGVAGGVACKLTVPYKCSYGEVVKVVGSHPELGAWDAHDAPAFTWQPQDQWTRELVLPSGVHELKAVIYNQETKTARWELVPNRTVEMPATDGVLHISFGFGSPNMDLAFQPQGNHTTSAAAAAPMATPAAMTQHAVTNGAAVKAPASSNGAVAEPKANGIPAIKRASAFADLKAQVASTPVPDAPSAPAAAAAPVAAKAPAPAPAAPAPAPAPAKPTLAASAAPAPAAPAKPAHVPAIAESELRALEPFERQILGLLANRKAQGLTLVLLHDLLHFTTTNPKFEAPQDVLAAYLAHMGKDGKVKYDEEQGTWVGLRLPTPPPVVARSPTATRRDATPRVTAAPAPAKAPAPAPAPAAAAASSAAPAAPKAAAPAAPSKPAPAPAAPAPAAAEPAKPLRKVQYTGALAGWEAFEGQLFGLLNNFAALSLERLHNIMTYTMVEPKFEQPVSSLRAALEELTRQGWVGQDEQGWYNVARTPEPVTPPVMRAPSPTPRPKTPAPKPARAARPEARPRSPIPVSRRVPTPRPTRLSYPAELKGFEVFETQTLGLISNFQAISLERLFSVMELTMVDPKFKRTKEELGAYLDWMVAQKLLACDDQGWYAYVSPDDVAPAAPVVTATTTAPKAPSTPAAAPVTPAPARAAAPAPAAAATTTAAVKPAAAAAPAPVAASSATVAAPSSRAAAPTPVRAATPALARPAEPPAPAPAPAPPKQQQEDDEEEVVEEVFVVRRIASTATAQRAGSPVAAAASPRPASPRAGSPRPAPQPDPSLALPVSQMPKEVPIWWPAGGIDEYRSKRASGEIPPLPAPAPASTPRPAGSTEGESSTTDSAALAVAMLVLAGVIFANTSNTASQVASSIKVPGAGPSASAPLRR